MKAGRKQTTQQQNHLWSAVVVEGWADQRILESNVRISVPQLKLGPSRLCSRTKIPSTAANLQQKSCKRKESRSCKASRPQPDRGLTAVRDFTSCWMIDWTQCVRRLQRPVKFLFQRTEYDGAVCILLSCVTVKCCAGNPCYIYIRPVNLS